MLQLGFLFGLLLVGGIATLVASWLWRDQERAVALVALGVFTLVWLVARFNLPLALRWGPEAAAGLPAWTWQVDSGNWTVGLALLLLSLVALIMSNPAASANRASLGPSTLTYLLTASALPAFCAADLTAHVSGWTWLGIVWALILYTGLRAKTEPPSLLGRLGKSWVAVLLLWLAALAAPDAGEALSISAWPTLTRSLVLLAATWQLLAFSAFARQCADAREETPLVALLHTLPAAAGAMLLARLEAAGDIGLGFALPLTLVGLIGLLLAMHRAWSYREQVDQVVAALLVAQANLTLLAGVWAGPQAVLAEARVLLISGTILLLTIIHRGRRQTTLLSQAGAILAGMALSAFPLTAGFTGRSAVYEAWLAQGNWTLLLVTAFLHLPLASAILSLLWPREAPFLAPDRARLRREAPQATALALPALLLLSPAGVLQAAPLTWLVILVPIASAVALRMVLSQEPDVQPALRASLAVRLPLGPAASALRRLAAVAHAGLRQALVVLEGEGGLLWLLLLLVIFWLAR